MMVALFPKCLRYGSLVSSHWPLFFSKNNYNSNKTLTCACVPQLKSVKNKNMCRPLKQAIDLNSHLFFGENHSAQQLIFQTFHSHSEVDDRRPGVDLGRVDRVREFRCDVKFETFHDVNLFVTDFHLRDSNAHPVTS